jgi:hypothetical protein
VLDRPVHERIVQAAIGLIRAPADENHSLLPLAHIFDPATRYRVGRDIGKPQQQTKEPEAAVGRGILDDERKSLKEPLGRVIIRNGPPPGLEDRVRNI